MLKKGDFHIHSTSSDGKCTPKEIIDLAKKRNVDIIAITDHNATDGIDEALESALKLGITVIPGVELSTKYNNKTKVHILGYFKDDSYKNEILVEILHYVKSRNVLKLKHILSKYLNFNYRDDKLSVEEGINILKFFGASVVLAHPVLLPIECFNEIINLNFDGIEAKYFSNSEQDTEFFLKTAADRNLFYTAGSDFHKPFDYYRSHGLIGDIYLNEIEIDNFLSKANLKQWIIE